VVPDIQQGELYWVDRGQPRGAEIGGRRPYVVLQNNLANTSGIRTFLSAPITTSRARGGYLGNVILEAGEGGLRERSVVNVSQTDAVDRRYFDSYIGKLSERRVREIITGLNLLLTPRG
jgi:mRNA interferase MazF